MFFLFCMVFVHLITIVAPKLENVTSPLVNCLVGSNAETKCGRMFEIHKENNAKAYRDAYTVENCSCYVAVRMSARRSIVMTDC